MNGYRVPFQKTELPGRDVDHTPTPSVEVKSESHYTAAPHIKLHSLDRDTLLTLTVAAVIQ
jgi:hypothetical protein